MAVTIVVQVDTFVVATTCFNQTLYFVIRSCGRVGFNLTFDQSGDEENGMIQIYKKTP